MEAGVVTSLHSDDAEISTRMNWEAGKLLRSGCVWRSTLGWLRQYQRGGAKGNGGRTWISVKAASFTSR